MKTIITLLFLGVLIFPSRTAFAQTSTCEIIYKQHPDGKSVDMVVTEHAADSSLYPLLLNMNVFKVVGGQDNRWVDGSLVPFSTYIQFVQQADTGVKVTITFHEAEPDSYYVIETECYDNQEDRIIWSGYEFTYSPLISSLHENIITSQVSIYPNPTTDFINLRIGEKGISGDYDLSIVNALGQKVLLVPRGTDRVDVTSLSKGFYFLSAYNRKPIRFMKE